MIRENIPSFREVMRRNMGRRNLLDMEEVLTVYCSYEDPEIITLICERGFIMEALSIWYNIPFSEIALHNYFVIHPTARIFPWHIFNGMFIQVARWRSVNDPLTPYTL
ncbi:hypothetical protein NPIL_494781 [Nephila pilipes]|uniref:Uncharacterized protein n=1 Tax=Nephila pilipes TaxID=299642 RepID=A0A8X6T5Z3_NEPPI|nr:hypothetical protein NPIL_494781 [Nephila pilipes]